MECCFCQCSLLRNRSNFEEVTFRQLLALGHQTLHRGKQNKLTLMALGEEISGKGILNIQKVHHSAERNGFVIKLSYTYKDIILSPECLVYWSRWTLGGWKLCSRPGFYSWQITAQAEKWRWCKFCKFLLFFKTWNFNPILKLTYLTACFRRFLDLGKAM